MTRLILGRNDMNYAVRFLAFASAGGSRQEFESMLRSTKIPVIVFLILIA